MATQTITMENLISALSSATKEELNEFCSILGFAKPKTVADTSEPDIDALFGKLTISEQRPLSETASVVSRTIAPLKTEDTGLTLEMAICLALEIPYDGTFKYDMEEANALSTRLIQLKEHFPQLKHTGKKRGQFDFTGVEDDSIHLSAKSTKKNVGKVAPQVIGQTTRNKFCNYIGIEYTTDIQLKQYFQENITTILSHLIKHTFDCPIIYYHKENNTIKLIKMLTQINWEDYNFSWTRPWEIWTNSSTLKIQIPESEKFVSILEVQFHSASRSNLAIRWCFEPLLNLFKENLSIVEF